MKKFIIIITLIVLSLGAVLFFKNNPEESPAIVKKIIKEVKATTKINSSFGLSDEVISKLDKNIFFAQYYEKKSVSDNKFEKLFTKIKTTPLWKSLETDERFVKAFKLLTDISKVRIACKKPSIEGSKCFFDFSYGNKENSLEIDKLIKSIPGIIEKGDFFEYYIPQIADLKLVFVNKDQKMTVFLNSDKMEDYYSSDLLVSDTEFVQKHSLVANNATSWFYQTELTQQEKELLKNYITKLSKIDTAEFAQVLTTVIDTFATKKLYYAVKDQGYQATACEVKTTVGLTKTYLENLVGQQTFLILDFGNKIYNSFYFNKFEDSKNKEIFDKIKNLLDKVTDSELAINLVNILAPEVNMYAEIKGDANEFLKEFETIVRENIPERPSVTFERQGNDLVLDTGFYKIYIKPFDTNKILLTSSNPDSQINKIKATTDIVKPYKLKDNFYLASYINLDPLYQAVKPYLGMNQIGRKIMDESIHYEDILRSKFLTSVRSETRQDLNCSEARLDIVE